MAATHPGQQQSPLPEAERGALTAARSRCCPTAAPLQTLPYLSRPQPRLPRDDATARTRAEAAARGGGPHGASIGGQPGASPGTHPLPAPHAHLSWHHMHKPRPTVDVSSASLTPAPWQRVPVACPDAPPLIASLAAIAVATTAIPAAGTHAAPQYCPRRPRKGCACLALSVESTHRPSSRRSSRCRGCLARPQKVELPAVVSRRVRSQHTSRLSPPGWRNRQQLLVHLEESPASSP